MWHTLPLCCDPVIKPEIRVRRVSLSDHISEPQLTEHPDASQSCRNRPLLTSPPSSSPGTPNISQSRNRAKTELYAKPYALGALLTHSPLNSLLWQLSISIKVWDKSLLKIYFFFLQEKLQCVTTPTQHLYLHRIRMLWPHPVIMHIQHTRPFKVSNYVPPDAFLRTLTLYMFLSHASISCSSSSRDKLMCIN